MGQLVTPDTDLVAYRPSHLSASQLQLYRLCPVLYRERYVLNLFPPPQPERLFGVAVHAGLEALFRGQDYERAFLLAWREYLAAFPVERFPGIDALRGRGLEVLDCVRNLGLVGEPERQIIMTRSGFIIPFFGYADLWDPDPSRPRVVDFKTSGFGWTQKKADDQLFQPAIYSQAYLEEYGQLPVFEFVVLPRIPAPIQVLDASRSRDQIDA